MLLVTLKLNELCWSRLVSKAGRKRMCGHWETRLVFWLKYTSTSHWSLTEAARYLWFLLSSLLPRFPVNPISFSLTRKDKGARVISPESGLFWDLQIAAIFPGQPKYNWEETNHFFFKREEFFLFGNYGLTATHCTLLWIISRDEIINLNCNLHIHFLKIINGKPYWHLKQTLFHIVSPCYN